MAGGKFKKPPLVEVEWIDACDILGSYTLQEARSKALAHRFQGGYLVWHDEKVVCISKTWDLFAGNNEPVFEDLTIIPTDWIVKIRGLSKNWKRGATDGTKSGSDSAKAGPEGPTTVLARDAVAAGGDGDRAPDGRSL